MSDKSRNIGSESDLLLEGSTKPLIEVDENMTKFWSILRLAHFY